MENYDSFQPQQFEIQAITGKKKKKVPLIQ